MKFVIVLIISTSFAIVDAYRHRFLFNPSRDYASENRQNKPKCICFGFLKPTYDDKYMDYCDKYCEERRIEENKLERKRKQKAEQNRESSLLKTIMKNDDEPLQYSVHMNIPIHLNLVTNLKSYRGQLPAQEVEPKKIFKSHHQGSSFKKFFPQSKNRNSFDNNPWKDASAYIRPTTNQPKKAPKNGRNNDPFFPLSLLLSPIFDEIKFNKPSKALKDNNSPFDTIKFIALP